MAKLIFTDDKFSGQIYELTLERTTVGRGNENTLVIRDPSLSSKHCEILTNGTEVIVRDLGSKNGTMVDGIRLRNQQSQLKPGKTVGFGSAEARLELDQDDSPQEDTAETAVYPHKQFIREQRRAKQRPPV